MRRFSLIITWLLSMVGTTGCLPDIWTWTPDFDDGLGKNYFELDPECELEGHLDVVLGFGEYSFVPMPEDHEINVYFGIQGGSHFFAGVRILNGSLDHSAFEVVLEVFDDDTCARSERTPAEPQDWLPDAQLPDRDCPPTHAAYRYGILGSDGSTNADGYIEDYGLFVIHENRYYGGEGSDRLRLSVRDPCGRIGTTERRIR